jgi:hypothetical protein
MGGVEVAVETSRMTASPNQDNRALVRALRVERALRKLYERSLREMMAVDDFEKFRRFCRATSIAGCEVQRLAKMTTDGPDAV